MEINLRASSIASHIDCPLRGASLALGLVDPLPSTPPACIGSAAHESTAAYDKAKLAGEPVTIDDAAEVAEKYIKDPPEEVNWGRFPKQEAIERALGVHTIYCNDVAPTLEFEAVELALDSINVDFPDLGVTIILTGTLDRIYKAKGYGNLDIKTGARACSQATGRHKPQLATYEILAEHTTGLRMTEPALIGALQTSADYKAELKPVTNSRDALLGTDGQIGYLEWLARQYKTGDFIGNPSSWLCSEKYCGLWKSCIFR